MVNLCFLSYIRIQSFIDFIHLLSTLEFIAQMFSIISHKFGTRTWVGEIVGTFAPNSPTLMKLMYQLSQCAQAVRFSLRHYRTDQPAGTFPQIQSGSEQHEPSYICTWSSPPRALPAACLPCSLCRLSLCPFCLNILPSFSFFFLRIFY